MQVFAGHSGPVQCGEFTPDGESDVLEPKNIINFWFTRQADSNRI
jgi:hypothetical protein